MPDTPAGTPIEVEDKLIDLATAARLTNRPLRVIQRWAASGILPVVRQDETVPKRKYIRLSAILPTIERKRWGTRRTRPKTLLTREGREITLQGQEPTDSAL